MVQFVTRLHLLCTLAKSYILIFNLSKNAFLSFDIAKLWRIFVWQIIICYYNGSNLERTISY